MSILPSANSNAPKFFCDNFQIFFGFFVTAKKKKKKRKKHKKKETQKFNRKIWRENFEFRFKLKTLPFLGTVVGNEEKNDSSHKSISHLG